MAKWLLCKSNLGLERSVYKEVSNLVPYQNYECHIH